MPLIPTAVPPTTRTENPIATPSTPTSSAPPAHRAWALTALVLLLALWLTTLGNLALWQQLWTLPEVHGWRGARFMLGMGVWLLALLVVFLSLLAWPRVFKPVAVFLLLSAAAATHFMLSYSIVIDSTMLVNVMHTDAKEAGDLLSVRMALTLLLLGVLPAVWLWQQPVRPASALRRVGFNAATLAMGLLVAVLALFVMFQDFASVMRNHKQVRYLINPLNTVYGLGMVVADTVPKTQQPLQPLGGDVSLGPTYAHLSDAPLFVLVVGETARAVNFGLQGYVRDTTPELKALKDQGALSYYNNVRSCGTNTQASVPCMFSHLGMTAFSASKQRHENLLDLLQHAGLAVVWIDNQSGCKGVCDRIPEVSTTALKVPGLCEQGECFDEVMIGETERQLNALPPERKARGTVVVMHQMGSHGPAYFKRSPAAFKVFQPECVSNALQECDREAVVNAYDNSIRYTDHFLAQTIGWLQKQPTSTALLYFSDHGESLGENNLYLHGLPYAIAPDEQKHVPMVTWLSAGMQQRLKLSTACLNQHANDPLSHDNLFHSVLGIMDIQTSAHQPALDIFAACKG
jgi:lipid A ethanolaminephosphotransferase